MMCHLNVHLSEQLRTRVNVYVLSVPSLTQVPARQTASGGTASNSWLGLRKVDGKTTFSNYFLALPSLPASRTSAAAYAYWDTASALPINADDLPPTTTRPPATQRTLSADATPWSPAVAASASLPDLLTD